MLNVSVFRDKKSPFWMTQVVLSNGRRVKRSTKVPLMVAFIRARG